MDTQNFITNKSGQTLEIYDTSSSKSGKVDVSSYTTSGNNLTLINNAGTLIIYGGTYTGGYAQNGAGIFNTGYFVMHNGTISGNSTYDYGSGGGVLCDGGVFVFEKGKITNNSSVYGAGVYLRNSSLKIYEGLINNNFYTCEGSDSTNVYGVGVYSFNSSLVMLGGEISENKCCANKAYGIGIYNDGSTFIMYDGKVTGNDYYSASKYSTASVVYGVGICNTGHFDHGVAEYPLRGTVMVYDGEISDNSTTNHADANHIVYGAGVCLDTSEHNGNYVIFKTAGGKICNNGTVTSNYIYYGAGIYATYACLLDLSTSEISKNGSIYTGSGIDDTSYGGGIYLGHYSDADLVCNLYDVKIQNNKANFGAGVCCSYDATLNIFGTTEISNNNSNGQAPAGIYVNYATVN